MTSIRFSAILEMFRLLKDIGQGAQTDKQSLVLLSYQIEIPEEIKHLTARFEVRLPDEAA